MKVVILAGGFGTRMREETEFKPKPMVEIGGKPVLWHIMKNFSVFNLNEFIICLGYKGDVIAKWIENIMAEGEWRVTLVDTGLESTTGERLKQVKHLLQSEDFICTYGDGLANVNVDELIKFHLEHGKTATVTAVQPRSRFGEIILGEDNKVMNFQEKPILNTWVNGGFFVFKKEIFDFLKEGEPLESNPLTNLAKKGKLFAYTHRGFWQPMDTYREYLELNKLWKLEQAEWKLWQ